MTSKPTAAPLPFPTTLIVVKGCPALNVGIREHWTVKEVRELGPDYSHATSIVIERGGKTLTSMTGEVAPKVWEREVVAPVA